MLIHTSGGSGRNCDYAKWNKKKIINRKKNEMCKSAANNAIDGVAHYDMNIYYLLL